MKWFIWILSPLSLLFSLITRTRNSLYDLGFFKELQLKIPIIGVGNITVGGTGKTPHCEYIAKTLDSEYKLALLSKGYGRNTKILIMLKLIARPLKSVTKLFKLNKIVLIKLLQ